jgi:hypothetical protein
MQKRGIPAGNEFEPTAIVRIRFVTERREST